METKDYFVGQLMGQQYQRQHKSESYVEIPPALLITDERGDTWSLGYEYTTHGQRFNWNVIRNDKETGEQAERIVYRNGRVKIFGWYGWKAWNGATFI
jgi:hypothetical protein